MAWRGVVLSSVMVLALGACNKPVATPGGAAAGPEAQPVKVAGTAPFAPPKRRPGLWTQTVSMPHMKQATKLCLDEAAEAKLSVWGAQTGKQICDQVSVTPQAGGWSFHSVCSLGTAGKTTTEGQATGDFNSHYQIEASSVTEGAATAQMNGAHKMSIEAVWEGPCPAGMVPGDMQMANGMTFNVLKMAGK